MTKDLIVSIYKDSKYQNVNFVSLNEEEQLEVLDRLSKSEIIKLTVALTKWMISCLESSELKYSHEK